MRTIFAIPLMLACCLLARAGEACDVPSEYRYRTSVIQGDLVVTLALDHATYLRGQPLKSYLGVENTGTDTVHVCSGWAPMNIFTILPDTCVSLDDVCLNTSLFFYPPVVYFFGECITILPGECAVRLVDWDGWTWTWDEQRQEPVPVLPTPGPYVALTGLYHPTHSGLDFIIPDDGIALPITISETSAVPVQTTSWGRLKARFDH